jgi:hypothetical protein
MDEWNKNQHTHTHTHTHNAIASFHSYVESTNYLIHRSGKQKLEQWSPEPGKGTMERGKW